MAVRSHTSAISAERLLWVVGTLGLLFCVLTFTRMVFARHSADRIVAQTSPFGSDRGEQSSGLPVPAAHAISPAAHDSTPAVVGRVEIPAIGMSSPLLAGDDSMSLTEGAGHIPGTALPGGLGTVGIAGHRDTHFRLLSKVRPGMDVQVIQKLETYHYRVSSTEIVTPEQVSVLDIVSEPGLVLVTCYPFHYIGTAPKRFVVHAVLVSASPDEPIH